MTRNTRSTSVPRAMQATYEAIVGLTDAFCDHHLNAEYRKLARDMGNPPLSTAGAVLHACA